MIMAAVALGATLVASAAEAQEVQDPQAAPLAPEGMWLGGGLNASGGAGPGGPGVRLEAGFPLRDVGPGQLSFTVPFSTYHDPGPNNDRTNVVQVVPELQWEYELPIDMAPTLSISPVVGVGAGGLWTNRTQQSNRSSFLLTGRFAAVVRLGFDNGAMLAMQPVGVTFNTAIGGGKQDGLYANYEWYLLAGYRWD